MFPINDLTLIKINGDPPVRWAEFEVDNLDDPQTVADVRAALEDRGYVLAGGGSFAEYEIKLVRRE
jgi:hypothetical protein